VQKQSIKPNKRQKRTHMSAAELIRLREEMNLKPRHMRLVLGIKSRRTYEDYEAGKRGIPEKTAAQIREAHRKDRAFMAGIPGMVHAALDAEYPGGMIPSDAY